MPPSAPVRARTHTHMHTQIPSCNAANNTHLHGSVIIVLKWALTSHSNHFSGMTKQIEKPISSNPLCHAAIKY